MIPRSLVACLSSCVALAALDSAVMAQTRKVSPPSRYGASGSVGEFVVSPDGDAVAYVLNKDGGFELHGVTDAGVRVLRDGYARQLQFAADGRTLVFQGDGDSPLFAVPVDGSSAAHALTPDSLDVEFGRSIVVAPTGWVVLLGVEDGSDANLALYSVRLDGRSLVRLDPPSQPHGGAWWFEVSPDGKRVGFVADPAASGDYELYVAPITGGAPARKVSGPLVDGGYVQEFHFTSDSQRLVYRANAIRLAASSLFGVAAEGGPVVRLDAGNTGSVGQDFRLSADGFAYFLHDPTPGRQLFRAPVKGGAAPVRVNGPMIAGASVSGFELAPDGSVLYRADQAVRGQQELYHVTNGREPRRLNAALAAGQDVAGFQVAPDGTRALFAVAPRGTVHMARLDSATSSIELPDGPTGPVAYPFSISASGEHLLFPELAATPTTYQFGGLYALRLDGVSSPVELVPGGPEFQVRDIRFGLAGERALVLASTGGYGAELFAVPFASAGAPARLNAPLPMNRLLDAVSDSALSADGRWAVFLYGEYGSAPHGLWSADLERGTPALQLTSVPLDAPGTPAWFRVSADSTRLVFRTGARELFSVPLDGSAPPLLLDVGAATPLEATSDGHVLFLDAAKHLRSAALDGAHPPVALGGFDGAGAVTFLRHRVSADGSRVVYHFRGAANAMHLFSAPLDGSVPAVRLDPTQLAQRLLGVTEGGRVVFQTAAVGGVQLWSAPLAGGVAPTPLATASLYQTSTNDAVALLDDEVAYVGAQNALLAVPADGHAPARPVAPGLKVLSSSLSTSDSRLYFVAWPTSGSVYDLWSLPLGLAGSPARVSRSVGYSSFGTPLETSDGARVVYVQQSGSDVALHSAPSDGSRDPLRLTESLVEYEWGSERFSDVEVGLDGHTVAFEVEFDNWATDGQTSDLYAVPSTAIAPARQVSPAPQGSSRIRSFHLDPRGRFVLYAGDQETAGHDELFVTTLRERPIATRKR